MTDMPSGPPHSPRFGGRLILSSDTAHERAKEEEASRATYRRAYWQKYSKRKRRVYGAITPTEYAAVAERAADAQGEDASVWRQIWAESQAYADDAVLPTAEIADLQRELLNELRRIGDSADALARRGELCSGEDGRFQVPEDSELGAEAVALFEVLEDRVLAFADMIGRKISK